MSAKIPFPKIPEPVIEVSAIHLHGYVEDEDEDEDSDEWGNDNYAIFLKVTRAPCNISQIRLERIKEQLVQKIYDRSDDEERDFEIASQFLLKFHEFSKNPDYCYLVGEIEDIAYPLVCALYRDLWETETHVVAVANQHYGNTSISLVDVHNFIRDKNLMNFDWFTAIDAVEFPLLSAHDASVEVETDKEF